MDKTLECLALSQGGVFTTRDAFRCGVDRLQLRDLIAQGHVHRRARGVHVLITAWPETGLNLAEARHRIACLGALRFYHDAHLCSVSRLVAAEVPVWGVPLDRVELVRPVRQEVLTQSYRIRPPDEVTRIEQDEVGIAAAVVQLGLDHGLMPAICAADRALHEGLTHYGLIEECVGKCRGRRGSSRLARLCELVDARSESIGESRLRVALTLMKHRVLVQVPVEDRGGVFGRCDLGIDGTNLLLEFDGRVKYQGADGEAALWAEKKRGDRIVRRGKELERFIWSDLDRDAVVAARVRDGLARSAPRPSAFEENQRWRTISPNALAKESRTA